MKHMPQIHHFSQTNPAGPDQGDVAALLRRVADTIDELGTVTIQDVTFSNEVTEAGLWPDLTVYFHYGELHEDCTCGHCANGTSTS